MVKKQDVTRLLESFDELVISYHTAGLPPPFSYEILLKMQFIGQDLNIDFTLSYMGRDELEEEEIFEEGFTLDDDYQFRGNLSEEWAKALKEQVKKTSWDNKQKQTALEIVFFQKGEAVFRGVPAELNSWEYLLQELMQAVFETSKKERPLEVYYKEIGKKNNYNIQIIVSFQAREAFVTFNTGAKEVRKTLPWKGLKKILKTVFLPDYLPDLAEHKVPSKEGKYMNPGDGTWYKFGKAILNPGDELDSLSLLEREMKRLTSS